MAACRKGGNTNTLIGEWKLVESSFIGSSWQAIPPAQEQTLIFKDDGAYLLNTSLLSSIPGCKGTYTIKDNMLSIAPDCMTAPALMGPLTFTVDENTLVIDHLITSSGFKTKYTRK